jgi:DNA-3-methyladenine glycosylase I
MTLDSTHTSRCPWCGTDPLYRTYHDSEWGVPRYDDGHLFEMLLLEGAQAGLAWITVLRKREGYRAAFDQFDANKIAAYTAPKLQQLQQDAGIIRNRLKIESAVKNARAVLELQARHGSFSHFIWQFVEGRPQQNQWRTMADVPASTAASDAMSKALKKAGCNFVGSTICYAYMQAVGMVNDHLLGCDRHAACAALAQ